MVPKIEYSSKTLHTYMNHTWIIFEDLLDFRDIILSGKGQYITSFKKHIISSKDLNFLLEIMFLNFPILETFKINRAPQKNRYGPFLCGAQTKTIKSNKLHYLPYYLLKIVIFEALEGVQCIGWRRARTCRWITSKVRATSQCQTYGTAVTAPPHQDHDSVLLFI